MQTLLQTNQVLVPITAGMFSAINAIMNKYGIDEEQVDDMSKLMIPW